MSNNYCVMTIRKIKSMRSLQMSHEHNLREISLSNVDVSLSDRNEELINDTGYGYRDLWYQRMKDIELKTGEPVTKRKNAVLAYEIVTTFSKGADVDMEAWKEANIKWMKDTFGEENVLSMQLHEDEITPHIHTIIIPIDERNKLCARSFTGGIKKMIDLQSSYGKAMEPLGLKRGEEYSRTRKEDLNHFYSVLNKAMEEKAPTMEVGERVDDYIARVNTYVQDMALKNVYMERALNRRAEIAEAKHNQFYMKYKEAIALQDDLEEEFGGNERLIQERIRTYRKIEKAVPRKILNDLLQSILKKFPLTNNILNFREDKKKRKKNSEYNINDGVEI